MERTGVGNCRTLRCENLLPRLLDVLMFGAMTRRNPFCDPQFERLFEASFDETLRRSVGAYLKREGISASRFGRTVLGDPGFVKNGLMKGRPVKLHTADRIRDFMHETPFGPLFGFEIEAFISLTGLKPWSLGEQSVSQPEFVARLRRGASPYLTTLDRVRGWMRTHVRPAERRGHRRRRGRGNGLAGRCRSGACPDACMARRRTR